jgi:hypothetical protein
MRRCRHAANREPRRRAGATLAALLLTAVAGCASSGSKATSIVPTEAATTAASSSAAYWLVAPSKTVPHQARWGIYGLRLDTQEVGLVYSTPDELSGLAVGHDGERVAFSEKVGGTADQDSEIFVLSLDGSEPRRLTSNSILDTYPGRPTIRGSPSCRCTRPSTSTL